MGRKSCISNKLFLLLIIIVFLSIFALTMLTPLIADDYSYCFSFADWKRISGLTDIVHSMASHRVTTNGRVFAHAIVQFFLMFPKMIFNIINGIASALLVYFSFQFFRSDRLDAGDIVILSCGICAVWYFLPDFGQVFLWLDGSVNYSWAMLISFIFVLPFFNDFMGRNGLRAWVKPLFFLFCFIAGAYSESMSLAMIFIASCFLAFSFFKSRTISRFLLICLAVSLLGYLFLMVSPSELNGRAGDLSLSSFARNIKYILQSTGSLLGWLYCGFFMILLIDLFSVGASTSFDYRPIIAASVVFLAGLGSVAAFAFARYFPHRALCATTCWTVLACQILLADLWRRKNHLASAVFGIVFGLFVFSFALGVLDISVIFKASLERNAKINSALDAGERKIALEPFMPETKYSAAFDLTDIADGENEWPNDSIAAYYGFESVSKAD